MFGDSMRDRINSGPRRIGTLTQFSLKSLSFVEFLQASITEFSSALREDHPHLFRHQMLTYLTSQGLSDAQIHLIPATKAKKA